MKVETLVPASRHPSVAWSLLFTTNEKVRLAQCLFGLWQEGIARYAMSIVTVIWHLAALGLALSAGRINCPASLPQLSSDGFQCQTAV
jgi:hypothetical protein